jgi:hypothetical protein
MQLQMPCPECETLRSFEQPPCPDGHGVDCPEWICTTCGDALLVATWVTSAEAGTGHPNRLPQRRAA